MFEELLDFDCSCGRHHHLTTRIFHIEAGAAERLPEVLAELGISRPLLVYDNNTYNAARDAVSAALPEADELILEGDPVHPDEVQIAALQEASAGHDGLVAVGSGVICDLTRYAAFETDLPFVVFPTAASVDGFVSNSSALSIRGGKVTVPAKAPDAVVCDLDIICAAPPHLAASGVGDMLSKYIAVADWKIGELTAGEYYCEKIADLEREAVDLIVSKADGIASRDPEAMTALVRGLLLSGLAMQLAGITRPASSFEHHFSHYLETVPVGGEIDTEALHGTKVGVATVYAAKYYPVFAQALGRIFREHLPNRFDLEKVKELYVRFPRSTVDWVEKENVPTASEQLDPVLLEKNFEAVLKEADSIPSPEKLADVLKTVGGPYDYAGLHMRPEEFREAMEICCYIRNRYTLLRLMCDYDLFDFSTIGD
ncbi:MAG: sn-glycerol-1-phosphate dehydrogenase [Clostridia bacterium]|nr:sn-glycerol-1-phosphate dehydrogenase [Clostridia bacterium]